MIEAHGAMAFGVPMDGSVCCRRTRPCADHAGIAASGGAARRPSGQYDPAAAARPEPYRGQLQPATHRRFGGRAARALPEWRWYAADCGRRSQWRCGQCVCDIVGATIAATRGAYPQFFEVARADLRLAALSGPEDAVEAIIAQRRLGSGWVSRFLQEILYEMLADKEAFHTVTNAGISTPPAKDDARAAAASKFGRAYGDGLNLWIPVRDEPAALRLLAEQGIRVAAGKPFLPSLRISADATGADAGPVRAWTRMPVEASASPSHSREPSTNKWPPPWLSGGRNAEDFDESLVILHELRSYARRGAARLYGVINGCCACATAAQVAGARRPGRRAGLLHRRPDQSAYQLPTPEKVAQEKPRCSRSTTASRRSSSYATWSNPSATSTASSR